MALLPNLRNQSRWFALNIFRIQRLEYLPVGQGIPVGLQAALVVSGIDVILEPLADGIMHGVAVSIAVFPVAVFYDLVHNTVGVISILVIVRKELLQKPHV